MSLLLEQLRGDLLRSLDKHDALDKALALAHETLRQGVSRGTSVETTQHAHLVFAAALLIRQTLVFHARTRKIDGGNPDSEETWHALLDLDSLLARLTNDSLRFREVGQLRYFAGCTREETAELLGVSVRTVEQDWAKIKKARGGDSPIGATEPIPRGSGPSLRGRASKSLPGLASVEDTPQAKEET